MNLKKVLRKRAKAIWLIVGLLILLAVGFVDYVTGSLLSLSALYLVPIVLLSWFVGLWAGLLALVLTVLDLFASEFLALAPGHHSLLPFLNAILELLLFLAAVALTTSLRKTLERERSYARTDHLTGALNARAFEEVAEREIGRTGRNGRPFTVAFADLDNFKAVNDRFGHATGDAVLQAVAGVVMQSVRSSDAFARLGGDEFALLLPECGGNAAPFVLTRLHRHLQEAVQAQGWPVTLSVGAVTFERPPSSYTAMLKRVDQLMYEAKREGKNSFRHVTEKGG
ncbi:MAG: GGDEF domain-containing protein [Acidobacteriota bacterium]